jgi:Zn-dependent oligopeptidase
MADTMAKTPENAMALMMKVWPAAVARVQEEVADMQAIGRSKGGQGAEASPSSRGIIASMPRRSARRNTTSMKAR